ncbi:MAG: hypothetical protein ACOC7J_00855 [Armatimonadota bacterium]
MTGERNDLREWLEGVVERVEDRVGIAHGGWDMVDPCELVAAVLDGGSGVSLIAAERERQIREEGWTPEHDDEHDAGELADAAASYTIAAARQAYAELTEMPDVHPLTLAAAREALAELTRR